MRVEYRYCPACGAALGERRIEGRSRPACPRCDFVAWGGPQVAVALLATDAGGRLLLIRRGSGEGQEGWALPGGYVDGAEDPALGAARECREETGWEVEVGGLVGAYHVLTGDGPLVVLAYSGRRSGGAAAVTEEAPEQLWVAANEVPQLAFSSHSRAVSAWRSQISRVA